ncbi:MAG: efflux RND transporter periplasmic adaptor subunit [Terriglobales bacterium]
MRQVPYTFALPPAALEWYIETYAFLCMPLNGNSSERSKGRWWVTPLLVLAAVAVLAAFVSRKGDPVEVHTAKVGQGKIRSVISTNGKIEPINNFEAHAPIPSIARRVLVREGAAVKKGQLLLMLDDATVRAQAAAALATLKTAQADLAAIASGGTQEEVLSLEPQLIKARTERDAAQRNLDALKRLEAQGAASAGEVLEAQSALTRANSQLEYLEQKKIKRYSKAETASVEARRDEATAAYAAAQDTLAQTDVRAPFDGIVYSLPIKQGNYVAGGQLLLQVADLRKVQVRAFVDEPDVARLSIGDPIEISWDAVPGRIWQAKVTFVPSTVTPQSSRNVGETTSIIDNKDFKLLPNVNVGVSIITAEHENVLMVPREAVRNDDSKPYVLQIVGHELKRRDVETALSNLTQVEITRGLSANDLIATGSVNGKPLGDGMQVKF